MTLHKIIDKICKCFRLAESANPNEAAAALRQAVGLMQKYDISEDQVDAYELSINQVNEKSVTTCGTTKPAYWILALSNLVAETFDCRVYMVRTEQAKPKFIFIGADNRPEIASYLYTVLYRSLGRSRAKFIKSIREESIELDKGMSNERRRRANVFAQAWLFSVSTKVKLFKKNQRQKSKITKPVDEYVQNKYGNTAEFNNYHEQTDSPDYDDIMVGMRAAESVELLRPLKNVRQSQLVLPGYG